MNWRKEHDTMGEVLVPEEHLWGAQTQRSLENFRIGTETIPQEVIEAFAILKLSAAKANRDLGKLEEEKAEAIVQACSAILNGEYPEEFPLRVWQTGSGTQSNMNVNEVIAHICAAHGVSVHPNDHVNMSQSSNDTFPTAMHTAAAVCIARDLIPAVNVMISVLEQLEEKNRDVIKIGRTHLQDAVPIRFSQEISGWRGMMERDRDMICEASLRLRELAIGGTAVGTGLNCPEGFAERCACYISEVTGIPFTSSDNKFHALTSKDAYVYVHGALKALAADLMKIANDVRWLASGPRCGLGEITIPANEPGSSIMPGKVNPTQCEAVTMIAVQVMGNDTAIGFGASQGNFQLNVFMPVLAYNMMQSIRLLSDGIRSFTANCISGIQADTERMAEYLNRSLMLVTCLSPAIGYENAAKAAHLAFEKGTTLKEAVTALGLLSAEEYDEQVRPEKMVQ
ncbi:MAG: class II fumarate hydratase [Erysipelotrichaceae bacterium]|nr:class II fumarate hydratase [Erysipelotrichaceae bacterium]